MNVHNQIASGSAGAAHIPPHPTVAGLMRQVLYALCPGIIAYVWFSGPGVLLQILLAVAFALIFEALMLAARRQPLALFLRDGSAVVTAVLFALCLPPLAPWWIVCLGMFFAIVMAKHLYGGLGQNVFNPAMVGYAVVLVSFPQALAQWSLPLAMAPSGAASHNWAWIAGWYAIGGLWLLWRGVITWHVPLGMIGSVLVLGLAAYLTDPVGNPSPLQQLFSGVLVLGAFFIATDPVSGCTSARGRLFFGLGAGVLTLVIRRWGAYLDGVAFAVLIMNMAAPLIDRYTRTGIHGHE